jgi:pyruvate kinase
MMRTLLLCSLLPLAADAWVARLPTKTSLMAGTRLGATIAPTNGGSETSTAAKTTVAAVPKVAQRWRKSTKQVITLGPASSDLEMIEKLFLAGADVFRLNFSHGSQEQKKELLDIIRSVEEKYSHPIAILGDLQGPKLRVSCGLGST